MTKFDSSFIFRKYPNLEFFSWNQFTPYIVDSGFLVNLDELKVKVTDKLDDDVAWGTSEYELYLTNVSNEIKTFLEKFDKEFYRSHFGDHAEIKINKDGIVINEYDYHD
jgi:hypothetical protein